MEVRDCSKTYGKSKVFEKVNYKFDEEIYWLKGPNGIGKSVFLRCLVGLEAFSSGEIIGERGSVLYLPDTSVAENWLTIDENLELMLYYFKIELDTGEKERIRSLLEISDGSDLVSQVSVGTSMKIGLSLLFVKNQWKTIILDEALSHIDNNVKKTVLCELEKRKNEGACIFLINHGDIIASETGVQLQEIYFDKNGISKGR